MQIINYFFVFPVMRLVASILLIVVLLLPSTPVYAQTNEVEGIPITTSDVKSMKEGSAWWDPFWDSCTAENYNPDTSPTQLVGKDNIERSYNYFIGKQLTPHQAAGILGNLRQESGEAINPKSNQPNGPGRGIAQWSEGGRWDHLVRWAAKQKKSDGSVGRDPEALDTQLDFIWYELTVVPRWKETLKPLRESKDYKEAVRVFLEKYEVAGDPRIERRYNLAAEVLEWYGGGAPGQVATENSSPGSPCGGSGILVDGYSFPLAPRTKRGGEGYTNLPCNAKLVRYKDRYNQPATIPNCHPGDGSPAFDLFYDGVGGAAVYALTDGMITQVDPNYTNPTTRGKRGMACASMMFKASKGSDKSFYWYGHILNPEVDAGKPVTAGQKIAVVAPEEYGPKCWGGAQHLHIDRGCINPSGDPQTGGGDDCRDPAFIGDMKKIYEGLPER